jgi:rieske iron-sulfur protein
VRVSFGSLKSCIHRISRRHALLLAAGGLGVGFRQADQAAARPKEGDQLIKVGDSSQTPLTADDIPLGTGYVTAWAMDPAAKIARSGSRLNQLLLLRLDPDALSSETRARAAAGVVAYTSICTHQGCDIDQWLAKEQHLFCSCHESEFDPRDAAKVVDGPAPRPLPALPLTVVDGRLVVAAPFTAPVGYERG